MEENKNEISVINNISKTLTLKKSKKKDGDLFPIGVMHQKKLTELFIRKFNRIDNEIYNRKKKSLNIFNEFYVEDIELSKEKINKMYEKINVLLIKKNSLLKKDMSKFLERLNKLKTQFENNLKFDTGNNWGVLKKFVNEGNHSLINQNEKLKITYSSESLHYLYLIEESFKENYSKPYEDLLKSLKKIKEKFDESVVLGDFGDVRKIYYFVDDVDEFLSKFVEPEIKKIKNIFKESENKFELQLKNYDEEIKDNNKDKVHKSNIIDVDIE